MIPDAVLMVSNQTVHSSGKLMTAIAQTKLVLVGKYDLMTGSMSSAVPPPAPDASIRVERIAKSLTSKLSLLVWRNKL